MKHTPVNIFDCLPAKICREFSMAALVKQADIIARGSGGRNSKRLGHIKMPREQGSLLLPGDPLCHVQLPAG